MFIVVVPHLAFVGATLGLPCDLNYLRGLRCYMVWERQPKAVIRTESKSLSVGGHFWGIKRMFGIGYLVPALTAGETLITDYLAGIANLFSIRFLTSYRL